MGSAPCERGLYRLACDSHVERDTRPRGRATKNRQHANAFCRDVAESQSDPVWWNDFSCCGVYQFDGLRRSDGGLRRFALSDRLAVGGGWRAIGKRAACMAQTGVRAAGSGYRAWGVFGDGGVVGGALEKHSKQNAVCPVPCPAAR